MNLLVSFYYSLNSWQRNFFSILRLKDVYRNTGWKVFVPLSYTDTKKETKELRNYKSKGHWKNLGGFQCTTYDNIGLHGGTGCSVTYTEREIDLQDWVDE